MSISRNMSMGIGMGINMGVDISSSINSVCNSDCWRCCFAAGNEKADSLKGLEGNGSSSLLEKEN